MTAFVERRLPQLLAGALCVGLAGATAVRSGSVALPVVATALIGMATAANGYARVGALALALALCGWWLSLIHI